MENLKDIAEAIKKMAPVRESTMEVAKLHPSLKFFDTFMRILSQNRSKILWAEFEDWANQVVSRS